MRKGNQDLKKCFYLFAIVKYLDFYQRKINNLKRFISIK